MTIELKHVTKDEYRQYIAAVGVGFGHHLDEVNYEAISRSDETGSVIGAVENGRFVGGTVVFPLEMTIPGRAILSTAVVSGVSVLPTHRRRGILTRMMALSLKEAHERGEILACLGASESAIYGRFGYGIATQSEDWTIERPNTALSGCLPRPLWGRRCCARGGLACPQPLGRLTGVVRTADPTDSQPAGRGRTCG